MTDQLKIISADSHVVEPWYLWRDRMPAGLRDRAPKLIAETDSDRLICEDIVLPPIGLAAGVFRSDSEVRREGRWDEDIPSSAYDPDARLAELEVDGISGEVLFPTLGLSLYAVDDLELKWALFRAYNDWLAEFCRAHPERYRGIAMLAHEDPELAVAEVERTHGLGLVGAMVPTVPGDDCPPYHDPAYDRLWACAASLGMPMHVHAATSRDKKKAYDVSAGRNPLTSIMKGELMGRVFLGIIFGGVFDRHPDLIFVSAENEAGWAPHMLDRADYEWSRYQNVPRVGYPNPCVAPPSTYWKRNIRLTFLRDLVAVRTYDLVGLETLMFQTDFPHGVSTYPNSRKIAEELTQDVSDEARERIVFGNAAALYGF
jgi:uncharacterized protein